MRITRRPGSALIYGMICTSAMAAMVALGVDWGRMQVTKNELRGAADAAARYGVAGLQNDISGVSAAYANAAASVAQNKANGRSITFVASQDVEVGAWSKTLRTFTPTTVLSVANAVRVTLRCTQARGSAVPMTFLSILGRPTQDITVTSTAMIDFTGSAGAAGNGRFEYFIPATSNPWLSGMPYGSSASLNNPNQDPDYAGTAYNDTGSAKTTKHTSLGFTDGGIAGLNQNINNYKRWGEYANRGAAPIQAGGLGVSGGVPVTMDGVNGGANNLQSDTVYTADGNEDWLVNNSAGAENGMANVTAPINSVIGIFLNDNQPSSYAAPTPLDFSTPASRDFSTLSPKLRQPFFIGDGRTSTGEVQQFVPPAGATRLFIATMDGYEWSNNKGGFYVTAHLKGRIITVK